MNRRNAITVGMAVVALVAVGAVQAAAAVPASDRVPVTDPQELAALGLAPDTPNVFRLVRPADVAAQPAEGQRAATPNGFGTLRVDHWSLDAKAFVGRESGFTYGQGSQYQGIYCKTTSTDLYADAPVDLPTGAYLSWVRWWVYDNDAAQDFNVYLWQQCLPEFSAGSTSLTLLLNATGSSGTPGLYSDSASIGTTVDNPACVLRARVRFGSTCVGSALEFGKLRFEWYRQISPSPATATFNDVPPSHYFFQYIEALADSGITTGCPAPNFCPDRNVTRAEMAAFLSRALGLNWYWGNF